MAPPTRAQQLQQQQQQQQQPSTPQAAAASGLQLPGRTGTPAQGAAGAQQATASSAAPSPRPGTGSGGVTTRAASVDAANAAAEGAGSSAPEGKSTNVDELMDAVGASGVDISAEEEGLRAINERLHAQNQAQQSSGAPVVDRSRKQDFIDQGVLAECVKKIAAAFQLRTLEPDTIPLIALATRHRLTSLINDAIAARDHRRNSSHLRPPPFAVPSKKKRKRAEVDGGDDPMLDGYDEEESEEEDAMDEFNFDFLAGGGKGKGKEKVPAWDTLVLDDGEKLLGVLERVDREEERKKRRERMVREQKEQEERDLAEAIAASEAAEREMADSGGGSKSGAVGGGTPGGSGPSTPRAGGDDTPVQLDKNGKPKKPRKKKGDGPATSARNMSEDVKKRLTDQVAMRSLGGKNFSWLNAGSGGGGGMGSPSPAGLPKPKFAPASSLPPPTFNNPASSSSSMPNGSSSLNPNSSALPPALGRLSNVPPLHDANRARKAGEDWERGANITEMSDLLWVLERERGAGVGKGSGRNVLLRGRAGVIKR